MNLEQMKARVSEIMNKLNEFATIENYSNEDVDTINALNEEFEGLRKNIEAKEKVLAMTAASNVSARKTSVDGVTPRVEVMATRSDKNGGFKSFGEFLGSVKKSATGEVDKRFLNANQNETTQADGGYLVPTEFSQAIDQTLLHNDESLFAKTKQFKVSSNNLSLPVSQSQPWSGGIQASWTNEAAAIGDTKETFAAPVNFKLNKLAALVHVTDELLDDSLALESYVSSMAPMAIMHKINEAIISGNGTGKPSGFIDSTFAVTVPKEVGQLADTIVSKNIIKMYSRMIPSARKGAAFYVNAGCEEQLRTMKDDNGNYIYLAAGSQLNQNPYSLLLGLPVIPMIGGLPELGDVGDICLVNLSYYYTISKGGIKAAVTPYMQWDKDVQSYKFTIRLDGKCPFTAPVLTQYGAHAMSAIVLLAERA